MSAPYVIPVFIAHQGCPHDCLFCDQRVIGEDSGLPGPVQVRQQIESWLARPHRATEVQVAFYGGSFTCLAQEEQERLLAAVRPYIDQGRVAGVRLSTRPDCVDEETGPFLRAHGVSLVELGVQSFDDSVLAACQRGHNAQDCRQAVRFLRQSGLGLGIQLMAGLPGEDSRSFLRSVAQTVALAPDLVRLYPALVLKGTGLARLHGRGDYHPLSLNRALALAVRAKKRFSGAGIKVVRMGLQPSARLEEALVAGPYHPAFGELVAARLWLTRARALLAACPPDRRLRLTISGRDQSAFVGPKRINIKRLAALGLAERLELHTRSDLARGSLLHALC